MRFSVTERGTYKRCRQQWDYASHNRQGLELLVQKPALSTGTLVHAAHAAWLSSPRVPLVDHFMMAANDELTRIKAKYLTQVGCNISDEELTPLYESVEMGRAMCINYQKRWGQPLPDGFELWAPEQTVIVPVPGTYHKCPVCEGEGTLPGDDTAPPSAQCTNCAGRGITMHELAGTFDGLMRDQKGRMWILEHKTYKSRPNYEAMETNDQFLAYIWILTQLGVGTVAGVAYDGMWKRAEPPKGKTFEDLFLRMSITRPQYEIESFGRLLALEINEMGSNPAIYLNRRWEGCFDCDFNKICYATQRGEDVDYLTQRFYTKRDAKVGWGTPAEVE